MPLYISYTCVAFFSCFFHIVTHGKHIHHLFRYLKNKKARESEDLPKLLPLIIQSRHDNIATAKHYLYYNIVGEYITWTQGDKIKEGDIPEDIDEY